MNDDQIQTLININYKVLTTLGVAAAVLTELAKNLPENKKDGYYWVMEAIDNALYANKPLPPMSSIASNKWSLDN